LCESDPVKSCNRKAAKRGIKRKRCAWTSLNCNGNNLLVTGSGWIIDQLGLKRNTINSNLGKSTRDGESVSVADRHISGSSANYKVLDGSTKSLNAVI